MVLRRAALNILLFVCFLCLISIETESVSALKTTTDNKGKKIIVIDPGHGGIDGGAVSGKGAVEKYINLKISLKLREKLKEQGYEVIMTREDDKGLYNNIGPVRNMKHEDLHNRCKVKIESDCHMFISVHQNYYTQAQYSGAQIWYAKSQSSKLLGEILQKNLREDLDKENKREAKSAGNAYKILRCYPQIPSVIIECGFVSNPRESQLLQLDTYQEKIADSVVRSINEYFGTNSIY
jgi:N-acetylmuramoyl-L-alanine amidase